MLNVPVLLMLQTPLVTCTFSDMTQLLLDPAALVKV